MKTLKLFIAVCFIIGFTLNLNAQTTTSKIIDGYIEVYIPCVPEIAVGVVSLTEVLHFDKDGNLTKWHYNAIGGELVGPVSGTIYHPVGCTQSMVKSSLSNGAHTETLTNSYMFIGKNGVNFVAKDVWHVTITSDGETIVDIVNTTATCK
jgi:hypothetical protein